MKGFVLVGSQSADRLLNADWLIEDEIAKISKQSRNLSRSVQIEEFPEFSSFRKLVKTTRAKKGAILLGKLFQSLISLTSDKKGFRPKDVIQRIK